MSVRHHHDHRLHQSIVNQIVENRVRPPDTAPARIIIPRAVQQVKYGILDRGILRVIVSGRCVDVHPPCDSGEAFRFILLNPHDTVWHRAIIPRRHRDSRDDHEAVVSIFDE